MLGFVTSIQPTILAIGLNYWAEATPIGFIFNLGVSMGFIVGVVIVYQVLYKDVSDHLAEYATLKAMGGGRDYQLRARNGR